MGNALGTERPGYATISWLRLDASRELLACPVAASDPRRLVLAAPAATSAAVRAPRSGERGEVSWAVDGGLGALPVELVGVQPGPVPLWHFRPVGPAEKVQRRGSVRASLAVPVEVTKNGWSFLGTTTDLSEGGFRGIVTGPGVLPATADTVGVQLFLDPGQEPLELGAIVVRSRANEGSPSGLSCKFSALDDEVRNHIRARVFLELRHRSAAQHAS